jgi:phosphohistidine phosphatase
MSRQTVQMGEPMSERILVLLRHAKSDRSGGDPDMARPLAERGRRQAPQAGRWLNDQLPDIDLVLVSPAERARNTWDLVSAELGTLPQSRLDARLYGASAEELLAVVRELPDDVDTVVLVGHNPGLEDLATRLTGEEMEMPTSAIAMIAVRGSWATAGDSPATLRTSGRPPAD